MVLYLNWSISEFNLILSPFILTIASILARKVFLPANGVVIATLNNTILVFLAYVGVSLNHIL